MDEIVEQAIARWPNVPAVFGWLRLDRRGVFHLVDRNQPGFDERLHGAGSPIENPAITQFIGRNYACDAQRRWYWQNGPQRVYVDLDLAPFVLRVLGEGREARLVTHFGDAVERIDAVLADEAGNLFVLSEHGPGAIHDLDLAGLELEESPQPAGDVQAGAAADAPMTLALAGELHRIGRAGDSEAMRFERRPRG